MDAKENRRERRKGREGTAQGKSCFLNSFGSFCPPASAPPRPPWEQQPAAPNRAHRKRNSLLEEQCLPARERDRVVGWGLNRSLSIPGVQRKDKGQPHLQVRFKAVGLGSRWRHHGGQELGRGL